MPQTYFADAWYFIALLEQRDTHHRNARQLRQRTAQASVTTHDAVLTEVLAYFSDDGSRARILAARTVRQAFAEMEVVSSSDLFLPALDRYEARPDKEYSLVDCMVLMEQRGIHHVLTNDHHFAQAGFTVVSQ
jgi:uncharacterized protein